MNKLLQSMLLALSLAFAVSAVAQAKDDAKATASAAASLASSAASSATASVKAGVAKQELLDINTASEKELEALPKIGAVRAHAIIKGRPYRAKDELVDKKILTADTYKEVKDLIIAKQKPAADKK
ncbi:hypothetical protein BH11PSE11_BH11PSE11_13420 [soil metagenome]